MANFVAFGTATTSSMHLASSRWFATFTGALVPHMEHLDWTERRDEARALLDEALRPDRVRPGRAASHRGRLLRSDAWFDAAGGPRA